MNARTPWIIATLGLVLGGMGYGRQASAAVAIGTLQCGPESDAQLQQVVATGWNTNDADNICGLRDSRMLSNPARVDFESLFGSTPEGLKIKKDGISLTSPEGVQLRQRGVDRVTRACEAARVDVGYCSVWKAISHTDGRQVPDITENVRKRL